MVLINDEVSLEFQYDADSGVCLARVFETIKRKLNDAELKAYANAVTNAEANKRLGRADLKILDRIDAITIAEHGMCLKDSVVTKARIKACKRLGLRFVDRGGLVKHMQAMFASKAFNTSKKASVEEMIALCLLGA